MSKRSLIVALFALVGGGLLALTAHAALDTWALRDQYAAPLASIRACGGESNPIMCSRPIVKKLLESNQASEIIDVLEERFGPERCHYVGHVVGQMTFVMNQSVELSLSQCGRACDSACVHGVIGEAFVEELGLGSPEEEADVDFQHLSPGELITVGRRLCASAQTCHGVGHAVFQMTPDLSEAMSICKQIMQPGGSACYNGVAMEYADILASRNMREVSRMKLPDVNTIASVCTELPSTIQERSCFRYYPRMVIEALKSAGYTEEQGYDEVEKICESYTSNLTKTACFSGIGSYNAYYVLNDQPKATRICEAISGPRNQAACYFGQIAVAVEERQNKLIQYCGILPDQKFQSLCYQTVFYYLDKFELPADNAIEQCGSGNSLCEEARKNYMTEPWDEIYANFSE
jgi:hypothetical protein